MKPRGRRRIERGVVSSAKMQKSIVVRCERLVKHPRFGKYVRQMTKYVAHDEHSQAREGDLVEITETRPLSKTKRWRLLRVLSTVGEPAKPGERQDDSDADQT